MSQPDQSNRPLTLSEQAIAAQAAELDRLRHRVADAQRAGRGIDPEMMAEYAQAQRSFLEAKIELEKMRMAGLLDEEPVPQEVPVETAAEEAVAVESTPVSQRPLLTASRVFWLVVILLLTALLWFMRSKFA